MSLSLELGSNSSWNTPHSFMKYTHCPAFFCDETKFTLSKRILTQRDSQTAKKFPGHSVLLKQKCKTFGCRPQAKNNYFSKIQQTKPFAGPFLLPKNFNLLCLNCTLKHWQLAQTTVGVSGYCIIFLKK